MIKRVLLYPHETLEPSNHDTLGGNLYLKRTVMDTNELLAERGKTHGDYTDHARITQALKRLMSNERNWEHLADDQRETLEMIAHKIGRVLAGNPHFKDHWDDIAGYAKLVANRLT